MSKTRRVVCTGVGMVSPLGIGAQKSWTHLLASKSGVQRLKVEHSYEGCQSRLAAYVPENDLQGCLDSPDQAYLTKYSKQLSRATIFAMISAHEALKDAKLLDLSTDQLIECYRYNCGVAIGQGMVDFEDIHRNANLISDKSKSGYRKISPFFMTRALINMSAGNVSIRYKLNGPNHCVSTACATGAHSIGDAFNFIKYGKANIMVCGSTEAAINSLAMAGFERLKALCTKYNDKPQAASRPFDKDRCGFIMGEGAGILILEELKHAKARGLGENEIYGEILGYGTSADAHHLTAPLPDGGGAKMCMQASLKDANLQPSSIGHVNAHATSTPLGDDIECNAIEEIFYSSEDKVETEHQHSELTVTSCKASIGHLLGAAGSVESIFAILSCKDALQPHCLNLERPLSTPKNLIRFIQQGGPVNWNCDRRVLIKNSFGFGGTNASLVISNYNS